jgi:hypothetical protein
MKVFGSLGIVVKQNYLLAFLVVVGTDVREGPPHLKTDDVEVDAEKFFQSRKVCVSQRHVVQDVYGLAESSSQGILSSIVVFTDILVIPERTCLVKKENFATGEGRIASLDSIKLYVVGLAAMGQRDEHGTDETSVVGVAYPNDGPLLGNRLGDGRHFHSRAAAWIFDGTYVDSTGGIERDVFFAVQDSRQTVHHGRCIHFLYGPTGDVHRQVQMVVVDDRPDQICGPKVFLDTREHLFESTVQEILDFHHLLFFPKDIVAKHQLVLYVHRSHLL